MFEFHTDKKRYFNIQKQVTVDHVIPFLESHNITCSEKRVLEIGCAEAGVLKAFLDTNNECLGIELSASRVELARGFHQEAIKENRIRFITKNIHDIDVKEDLNDQKFDIILLKDVIEHIFDRDEFMNDLHKLLNPDGVVFFAFPPWQMPFGGHQQICKSKFLSKLPYFHLLPKFAYRGILKIFKEPKNTIQELLEIKETQISIGQFGKLIDKTGFNEIAHIHYLINPIYEHKFGLNPRKQLSVIGKIPYLRNFITTGVYYLIKAK